MLKPYDNQADIPEEFKEHYSRREDGKWHADIPNDHPAVKHNATLLSEKQTAEEKARTAEAALASAQASGLPRGHVAVPKADADLLEKLRAAGTPEQVAEMIEKYPTLKTEAETNARKAHLGEVADALGYDREAFIAASLKADNAPEFELRDGTEKDAKGNLKKIAIAKVKGADNVVTEKPGKETVESHPDYKPFLGSLTPVQASGGTKVFGSAPGSTTGASADIFAKTRDEVKAKEGQKPDDLNQIFKPKQQAA